MVLSWLNGRPSTLGLAAVTPASGYVTPLAAMVIGAVAVPLSYYAIRYRQNQALDESLDVWACHGMASTWGTLTAGLFATTEVNAQGGNGLFFGNHGQFGVQLLVTVVSMVFAFVVTYVLAKLPDWFIGMRVNHIEEEVGLDIRFHYERAYS